MTRWTDHEDTILHTMYPSHSRQMIMRALPGRTWYAAIQRAKKLGLRRQASTMSPHRWTPEEDDRLREVFGVVSEEALCQMFPRHTYLSTLKRAGELGLSRLCRDARDADIISATEHHRQMSKKYFPAFRDGDTKARAIMKEFEAGIVAMVNRINAGRQDARDLRR